MRQCVYIMSYDNMMQHVFSLKVSTYMFNSKYSSDILDSSSVFLNIIYDMNMRLIGNSLHFTMCYVMHNI